MGNVINKTGTSSSEVRSDLSSFQLPLSVDCSPFLNWNEELIDSAREQAVVFRSLVSTLKSQPVLDDFLVIKAMNFLESVPLEDGEAADAFLGNLASLSDDSDSNFVQSILVLVSSASQIITTAAMKTLKSLLVTCSAKISYSLVKADLIPQLIIALNPLSLSFTEAEDIHISLTITITCSLWLSTQVQLAQLEIDDHDEQQAVHETVLKQVVVPSEKYIWYLCVNQFSIVDGKQSNWFLALIAILLEILPYYQPTLELVIRMPVVFTIPSCLTFFEDDGSTSNFLYLLIDAQLEWNKQSVEVRKKGKIMLQMLRMEGIEDVIEEKLQNDQNESKGGSIVAASKEWNNQQGMNLPQRG
ncbi:hypothetical protein BLNAU_3068 [Blattamonas nauphoetae]|uniref:Uncharacterized protein n=1 Tax=Blattamonas nauphoetae TaxID=2049346 RepID=A0ABQ9YE21_9EUKA|nr:hypothetical protein BLNAU_3068 [Blattamonas nauphoetae]